jgi:methyl-accepting chemotaxis protein
MRQLKLGTKLLIGGLLTVAVPVIVIGVVAVYQSTQSITELARISMGNTAQSLAAGLDNVFHEQLAMVRNISYSNSVIAAAEKVAREGEKNSQKEIFLAQRELTKIKEPEGEHLSSIMLVGKNGITYASSDNGKMNGQDVSGRDYLDAALKGKPNVGSVVISRATGRVVCTAVSPIYASTGKEITGVVVMVIEMKFLTDTVDEIRVSKSGYAYLVDKSGHYIAHPVKEKILKENISLIQGMETLVAESGAGKSGVVEYILEGIPKIATFAPVPITGWTVVNSVPAEELFASAYLTRNVIVSIGMIFLILASAFFFLFARNTTRPLIDLVGAAKKIAAGDLAVEVTDPPG